MNPNILKRYTDLPAVIDLLMNGRITLLDPMSWDDKNDSFYLSVYKEKMQLGTLLALCFTQEAETYHHWKIFSGHTGGVCIVFKKDELLSDFSNESGIRHQAVEYWMLDKIKQSPLRCRHFHLSSGMRLNTKTNLGLSMKVRRKLYLLSR